MGSDTISWQTVSELSWIIGHPAGVGEFLGSVEKHTRWRESTVFEYLSLLGLINSIWILGPRMD